MKDWKQVVSNNTLGEQMDIINENSKSSAFLDEMTSKIMSNGYIYTGKETVGGLLALPLTNIKLPGVVPSELKFDNFKLFFRNTSHIIELDQFPVDLKLYNTGIPQFLYFREDFSYRVSDYMYGQTDEVLLARFIINEDRTWNQFYVIPQRASSPLYHSGDEFYELDGLYVKSPGGLELSTTEGTVKRSGIDFSDLTSPDVYNSYRLENVRVPIRYVNTFNKVDYSIQPQYNIITNKMMNYDKNIKLKVKAEELIRGIINTYYGLTQFSEDKADELHTAITLHAELEDKVAICNVFVEKYELIYNQVNALLELLGDTTLSSVDTSDLSNNISLVTKFIDSKLKGAAIAIQVTEAQVLAMRQAPSYVVDNDRTICDNPLEFILQDVLDDLSEIVYPAGSLEPVPDGKFTIQRILWDVYEDCFIIQYGNKIYNSFNEAAASSGLMDFPAPFGKTIYIPMAILVLKSGITSINDDNDTLIITRRWVYVDESYDQYSDIIARAKADEALRQIQDIIGGVTPVGKADSLKYTDAKGNVKYESGDFYLNYENLRNKLNNINDLTHSVYSKYDVLSAYQGYLLDQKKVEKTKSGDSWIAGNLYHGTSPDTSNIYIYSTGGSIIDARTMSKSDADSQWNNIPRNTIVFCWS